MFVMECQEGGSLTLSRTAEGYRLRLFSEGKTMSVILTTEEARTLQERLAVPLPEKDTAQL